MKNHCVKAWDSEKIINFLIDCVREQDIVGMIGYELKQIINHGMKYSGDHLIIWIFLFLNNFFSHHNFYSGDENEKAKVL